MDNNPELVFRVMLRDLRKRRGLKLRQVAEVIGVAPSTYGNAESSAFRVFGEGKAAAVADFYRLTGSDRESFMSAWAATKLSPFSEKRREIWHANNERRSAARRLPKLELAMAELLGVHIGAMDDDKICVCDFGNVCEVCAALELLGLDRFSTRDHAIDQIAKLQEKLAAAQNGAKP